MDIAALSTPPPAQEKTAPASKQAIASSERQTGENETQKALWNKILQGVKEQKIPTHALMCQGKFLGIKDDALFIGFKKGYKFHKERMEEKANREIAETVVKKLLNKDIKIQFIFLEEDQYNDIVAKKALEYFGENIVEIKD